MVAAATTEAPRELLRLHPGRTLMSQSKRIISIAILLLIALHAVPVLHSGMRKRMWPILDWAMYKDSRPAGPIQADKRRLVAVTATGSTERVGRENLGVSSFVIDRLYFRPMRSGDMTAAQALLDRLNAKRTEPFVEVRLESETYRVTDTGIVRTENPAIVYRAAPSHAQ
jgi:hypothetical protein